MIVWIGQQVIFLTDRHWTFTLPF